MSVEIEHENEHQTGTAITPLVTGIIQDARDLFVNQMTLFQVEIKNDVNRVLEAIVPLLVSAALALIAGVTLATGCSMLLSHLVPSIQLWASFLIVGGIVAVAAGLAAWWGYTLLKQSSPMPDKAIQGLKENLQWKTKK